MSDIALPHFFGKIFRSAPCERNDRVRRVLVRIADERSGVRNEEIPDLVALAEFVQRAGLWIVAHPNGSHFVNDRAASRNWRTVADRSACCRLTRCRCRCDVRLRAGLRRGLRLRAASASTPARWRRVHLSAQPLENPAERRLHVTHLIELVIAPLPMEA